MKKTDIEKEEFLIYYHDEVYKSLSIISEKIIELNKKISWPGFDRKLLVTYKEENDEFKRLTRKLSNLNDSLDLIRQSKKNPPTSKFFSN